MAGVLPDLVTGLTWKMPILTRVAPGGGSLVLDYHSI